MQLKKFYQINVKAWGYSLYGKASYDYYKKDLEKSWQDEIHEQATYRHGDLFDAENKKDFSIKDEKTWGNQLNEWIAQGVSNTRIRTLLIETLEKENFNALDEVFEKHPERIYPFYKLMWEKETGFKSSDLGKIYMCEKMRTEKPHMFSYKELMEYILKKNGSEEMITYCISTALHENKEINVLKHILTLGEPSQKREFAKKYLLHRTLENTLPQNEDADDNKPVMKI